MLFFITGASGAGKSSCLPGLRAAFPDMAWYEFDSGGVPPDADTAWRQRTLEDWMQRAREHAAQGQDCGICGQVAYGEILAAPSAPASEYIAICLLDCLDPVVRIDRLRAHGLGGDTQEMLNWAAWLRLHAANPEWRPDVIRDQGLTGYRWDRWADWRHGDPRWSAWMLDTTALALAETLAAVTRWIQNYRSPHATAASPSDALRITVESQPSEEDVGFIEDHLDAFNMTTTRMYDYQPLAIFVRDAEGALLGGLTGFTWGKCLKVSVLWLSEPLRHQGYGARLLAAAEREAMARGCRQAMLETHSFQAPAFYERHGYVRCGAADDFPAGHREYLYQKRLG